jgi:hypothetical protein
VAKPFFWKTPAYLSLANFPFFGKGLGNSIFMIFIYIIDKVEADGYTPNYE